MSTRVACHVRAQNEFTCPLKVQNEGSFLGHTTFGPNVESRGFHSPNGRGFVGKWISHPSLLCFVWPLTFLLWFLGIFHPEPGRATSRKGLHREGMSLKRPPRLFGVQRESGSQKMVLAPNGASHPWLPFGFPVAPPQKTGYAQNERRRHTLRIAHVLNRHRVSCSWDLLDVSFWGRCLITCEPLLLLGFKESKCSKPSKMASTTPMPLPPGL